MLCAPPCSPLGPERPSAAGQGPVEATGPWAGPAASAGFNPFNFIRFFTSFLYPDVGSEDNLRDSGLATDQVHVKSSCRGVPFNFHMGR